MSVLLSAVLGQDELAPFWTSLVITHKSWTVTELDTPPVINVL